MSGKAKKPFREYFQFERRFHYDHALGLGAYGLVCAAKDDDRKEMVAIKRIGSLNTPLVAKRTLREIKLLRHFKGHPNIAQILEILPPTSPSFTEIYVIQELMDVDMSKILQSKQTLTESHFQYFLYQMLNGLQALHSANVVHRDLKPSNLLLKHTCDLKIADFGLARALDDCEGDTTIMTNYVATRWYRAPELMLSTRRYERSIDIWSVGCIFGEMLASRPLFPGNHYIDQLNKIFKILGTPNDDLLGKIASKKSIEFVKKLPQHPKQSWTRIVNCNNPLAIDLLEKMLKYDPAERISVQDAMKHPYLSTYYNSGDENGVYLKFDFSFDLPEPIDAIKKRIWDEIADMNGLDRQRAEQTQNLAFKLASIEIAGH